jgi:hypothetical protein
MHAIGLFFLALFAALTESAFLFYGILFVAVIIITALEENDKGGWAFIMLLFSIIFFFKFHVGALLTFIAHNPGRVFLYVLGYFAAGAIWGCIKWYLFVRRKLAEYEEKKAQFLHERGVKEFTPELAAYFFDRNSGSVPQVYSHKGDIILWMTYWPFSILWSLLADFVQEAFRIFYNFASTYLQRLSDRLFKTVSADKALADAHAERVRKEEERAAEPDNNRRF